jgi:hypothetical protein
LGFDLNFWQTAVHAHKAGLLGPGLAVKNDLGHGSSFAGSGGSQHMESEKKKNPK